MEINPIPMPLGNGYTLYAHEDLFDDRLVLRVVMEEAAKRARELLVILKGLEP